MLLILTIYAKIVLNMNFPNFLSIKNLLKRIKRRNTRISIFSVLYNNFIFQILFQKYCIRETTRNIAQISALFIGKDG